MLELIVRLGKTMFFETKKVETVAEATQKILHEYILPRTLEKMPWQEWREEELWTLECDDLFKANKNSIDGLIKWCKKGPMTKDNKKDVQIRDCQNMIQQIDVPLHELDKKIFQAYSISHMTIIDEMEDFDKYQQLKRVEFLEFIGRLAAMLYPSEQLPLVKKIEKLLGPLIQAILKVEMMLPDNDDGIESESDCEDDLVEEVVRVALTKRIL